MNDYLEQLDHDRKWDARHSNGTIQVDTQHGETWHHVWTAQMACLNSIQAVAHPLEAIGANGGTRTGWETLFLGRTRATLDTQICLRLGVSS